jgi:hypothetical protein
VQSGCNNIVMLGLLPSDQISKICKRLTTRVNELIVIMAIQEQSLQAMRFWVANLRCLLQPVNPEQFMTVLALNQAQIMQQYLEDEARADKETVAKKFKMANNWTIFAEALGTSPAQLYGRDRVPLSYVICREVVALPGVIYEAKQARSIALAPLNGMSFQRDNARVCGIIKQLVLEGPGHTFFLRFDSTADGQAAWNALKAHYEGEGF